MGIRKRYDEAKQIRDLGLVEASLILTLVATAAASEKYRISKTGKKKKDYGDDSKFFREYVSRRIDYIVVAHEGKDIRPSNVLYKYLRNEAIHEGKINNLHFDLTITGFRVSENTITFGPDIIDILLENIRTDPLLREEFRDLLAKYENIIQFSGQSEKQFISKICEEFDISPAIYGILLKIVKGLTPEALRAATTQEMTDLFQANVLANLREFGLNGGSLTGLSVGRVKIINRSNELTTIGHSLLATLSENYATLDSAIRQTESLSP